MGKTSTEQAPEPTPVPEPDKIGAEEIYAQAMEEAALLRADGEHAAADQLAGMAVEVRRRARDAALVLREAAHYAEGHKVKADEE